MAVGFHRLCCLWEAQRGDGDVYKIWNVHTGLIYGLHRSATTLKPLGENNIDHLVTMQCSVGKPGVLALMWIFWRCLQTLQIPIWSSFCDNPQDPMDLLPKSWCLTLQLSVVCTYIYIYIGVKHRIGTRAPAILAFLHMMTSPALVRVKKMASESFFFS